MQRAWTLAVTVMLGVAGLVWLVAEGSALRIVLATVTCLLLPGLGWSRKFGLTDRGDTLALAVALSICASVAVSTTMAISSHWAALVGAGALLLIGLLGCKPTSQPVARRAYVEGQHEAPAQREPDPAAWEDWYNETLGQQKAAGKSVGARAEKGTGA